MACTPLVRLASSRAMSQPTSRVIQLVRRLFRQGSGPATPCTKSVVNPGGRGLAPIPRPCNSTGRNQTDIAIRTTAVSSRSSSSVCALRASIAPTSRTPAPSLILNHPDTRPAGKCRNVRIAPQPQRSPCNARFTGSGKIKHTLKVCRQPRPSHRW